MLSEISQMVREKYHIKYKSLLKGQCTQLCLQPLTLDSSQRRTEGNRATWGESGIGGSGKKAERTATRISVLSHS